MQTGGICTKPGDERGHLLDPRSEIPFEASEEAALARLRHFLYGSSSTTPAPARHPLLLEADAAAPAGQAKSTEAGPGPRVPGEAPVRGYGYRRADAVGVDNSAKLSVFLSSGLLSPRTVYAEVQAAIAAHSQAGPAAGAGLRDGDTQVWPGDGQPGSAPPPSKSDLDWMVMCLTIRDHYIFTALRENDKLLRSQVCAPWSLCLSNFFAPRLQSSYLLLFPFFIFDPDPLRLSCTSHFPTGHQGAQARPGPLLRRPLLARHLRSRVAAPLGLGGHGAALCGRIHEGAGGHGVHEQPGPAERGVAAGTGAGGGLEARVPGRGARSLCLSLNLILRSFLSAIIFSGPFRST